MNKSSVCEKLATVIIFSIAILQGCSNNTSNLEMFKAQTSSNNLDSRRQENTIPLKYIPSAIITGKTGVGKTTIVNNLCGTSHAVNNSGINNSGICTTRELSCDKVNCGNNSFELVDTPGTDSEEIYQHSFLLWSALTIRKFNTIFVTVKYDRSQRVLRGLVQQMSMFKGFTHKIVVLLTCWDVPTNCEKSKLDIISAFDRAKIPNNIIFCSNRSDVDELSNVMYSCISQMVPEY